MTTKKKNKGGRPTKLGENFLKAAEEVLNGQESKGDLNMAVVALTDEMLWERINEKLEEKDQICYTTFKNWKAKTKREKEEDLDNLAKKFLSLYKKALSQQLENLLKNMAESDPQWTRFAWIIERKFDEWNLRKKSLLGEDPDNRFQSIADLVKSVNE
jgi:hypothetical protein